VTCINRATGEERWRVNKARGVRDSRGRMRLVVTVIEDITDQKRAEVAQRLLSRTRAEYYDALT
jgi:signal transduction histidine kinase